MSSPLGQTPNHTVSLTQTDTHVFWRGQWHRFAGAEDPPPTPVDPPPAPAPVTPPAGQTPPAKPFDDAYVRDLRKETATYRKQAEDAQARLKEIDDAQKSDLEKAEAKAAAAEQRAERAEAARVEALIRAAVMAEAGQQGAVKADVVYRLVDRSAITLDDSGEVKGADKAVKALLEAEPYLKAGTTGTTAVPGTPRQNGAAQTKQDLIEKTKEELRASGRYARF